MSTNDELMVQFIEMTGSDPDTALYYLQISNFNLENALNLLFSGDIPPPPPSHNDATTTKVENDVNHFEEEHIREADQVKQQILLDYSTQSTSQRLAMQSNLVLGRAEDPSVEWMFPPPSHLSFPGTLAEARALAKKEQKWILVNIQCDKEFSSHLLNRDVWTNETLVSLIRMNFIFWQRGRTSQDGEMFVGMHRLSTELGGNGFPMIGIVDSRTGALICDFKVTSSTDANEIILQLMEFLESNSFTDAQAPMVPSRIIQKGKAHSDISLNEFNDNDEDDEEEVLNLAAALKASMQNSMSMKSSPSLAVDTDKKVDTVTPELHEEIVIERDKLYELYSDLSPSDLAEPSDDDGAVKVSLKLVPELLEAMTSSSNSKPKKTFVRSFHGENQKVQHVYAVVYHLITDNSLNLPVECQNRDFDLFTAFPRASLNHKRGYSVKDAGLKGAQVIMQWV